MIRGGYEARVTIIRGQAIKRYTANYHELNREYNRPPERVWYEQRVIPMMPRLIRATPAKLVLEYAGEPLNPLDRYPNLDVWAENVLRHLRAAGVHHRDIHPGNVLHLDGRYALIDWTWANPNPNAPARTPRPSDEEGLERIARLTR